MFSPELLRLNPFFAGFSATQLKVVAQASEERTVEQGHLFFYEGEDLCTFYVLLEGDIVLTLSVPENGCRAVIPLPTVRAREVVVSVVRPRELFAWSALVPPFKATSNGRAVERSRVLAIDGRELRKCFKEDPALGYMMMLKVTQIARDRLLDMQYDFLADAAHVQECFEHAV